MATIVQIKRSSSGNAPNTTALAEAELAYSQDRSGNGANAILYIESVDSGASPVIHKVGGKYYTDIVDARPWVPAFNQANTATTIATSAFAQANAAYATANSVNAVGAAGFNQANVAFAQANVAFNAANTATTYATSAYAQANTATTYATSAFGAANSAASAASSAQGTADSALSQANLATNYAQSAYEQANVATTYSTSAFGRANVAFAQANVAFAQANTAFAGANIAATYATSAFAQANTATTNASSAFARANVANDLATKAIANVLAGTGISVTGYGATQPNVTVALTNTSVGAGSYGGTQNGVAIIVDAQGRITSATNTNMSSNLTINGNGGTDVVQVGVDSLTVVGAQGGISTSVTDNVISIVNTGVKTVTAGVGLSTDLASGNITLVNTGVRKVTSAGHGIVFDVNTGNVTATFTGVGNITGTANEIEVNQGSGNVTIGLPNDVTIGNDLSVTGNLYVLGNIVALPVETLIVDDSLIQLANTNFSTDIIDIGFFGSYGPGNEASHYHTGLFRDASDGRYKLFQGLTEPPSTTVNITGNNYSIATLVANLTGGNITSLINAIAVDSGGTGRKTLTANAVLYGDGTNAVALATGSAGQVLQLTDAGMVAFGGIDGGTF